MIKAEAAKVFNYNYVQEINFKISSIRQELNCMYLGHNSCQNWRHQAMLGLEDGIYRKVRNKSQ